MSKVNTRCRPTMHVRPEKMNNRQLWEAVLFSLVLIRKYEPIENPEFSLSSPNLLHITPFLEYFVVLWVRTNIIFSLMPFFISVNKPRSNFCSKSLHMWLLQSETKDQIRSRLNKLGLSKWWLFYWPTALLLFFPHVPESSESSSTPNKEKEMERVKIMFI